MHVKNTIKSLETSLVKQNKEYVKSKYGFYFTQEMIFEFQQMNCSLAEYFGVLEDKKFIREFRNPSDLFIVQFTYTDWNRKCVQRMTTSDIQHFVNGFLNDSPLYRSWIFINVYWRCYYHPKAGSYSNLRDFRSISIDHQLHCRQIASYGKRNPPLEGKPTQNDVARFINQIRLKDDTFENKIHLDILNSYLALHQYTY